MTFKNCPECNGKGSVAKFISTGVIEFEICQLCKERSLYKRQFEVVARNLAEK